MVVDQVRKHTKIANSQMEKYLIVDLNDDTSSYYIFTNTSWMSTTQSGDVGFVIINSHRKFILASCNRVAANAWLEAKLYALEVEIIVAQDWRLMVHTTCTNHIEL